MCKQREALVHLGGDTEVGDSEPEQHLCEECADANWARTPGMNMCRGLICLSDFYRSKLYDLLELEHPEALDNSDTEACARGGELMEAFLRRHLAKDGIKLNDDGFEMLLIDFMGSHHFYDRIEEFRRKKG